MEVKTALQLLIALAGFPAGVLIAYLAKDELKKSFKFIRWTKVLSSIVFLAVYLFLNDNDNYLLYLFSAGFAVMFFLGAEYLSKKIK